MTDHILTHPELFQYAQRVPHLSDEQEKEYGRRIQESQGSDQKAIDALVKSHLRFAISIARGFRHYKLPLNDLTQEASCGLTIAALRFDPDRNIRFSAYAQWWIKAYITEYVIKNWSLVRINNSRNYKTLFFNIRKIQNNLQQSGHTEDHLSEEAIKAIAAYLKVKPDDVRTMEQRLSANHDQSIHAPHSENGLEKEDTLPSKLPNPDSLLDEEETEHEQKKAINNALNTLTDLEKMIIQKRLLTEKKSTFKNLSEETGMSRERIRQIEGRALKKMAQWMNQNIAHKEDLMSS